MFRLSTLYVLLPWLVPLGAVSRDTSFPAVEPIDSLPDANRHSSSKPKHRYSHSCSKHRQPHSRCCSRDRPHGIWGTPPSYQVQRYSFSARKRKNPTDIDGLRPYPDVLVPRTSRFVASLPLSPTQPRLPPYTPPRSAPSRFCRGRPDASRHSSSNPMHRYSHPSSIHRQPHSRRCSRDRPHGTVHR